MSRQADQYGDTFNGYVAAGTRNRQALSLVLTDRSVNRGSGSVTVTVTDRESFPVSPFSEIRVNVEVAVGVIETHRLNEGQMFSIMGVIRTAAAFSTS